ncbi:GNAT family N-acetyltransferase [Paenibacillus sp. FSL H8-0034]|uniref:GNAT family N-acetyltransferase n=1 Tax=Paenibacillus sp. FSL H8-0034 TaxID=2954671 RepID=UPI0040468F63
MREEIRYFRGKGAAEYLIGSMMFTAKDELHVKALHLVCHNTNTRALMFYTKLNFKPYEITMRTDKQVYLKSINIFIYGVKDAV